MTNKMLFSIALFQQRIHGWVRDRKSDERGASLVEYALLLALIAVAAIVPLTFIGHAANNTLQNVGTAINAAG